MTDQESWSRSFPLSEKKSEKSVKGFVKDGNLLWEKMKDRVEIKYVGVLKDGTDNPLYNAAHDLSRQYINQEFPSLKFG
ncbi:hypothetical protein [Bacillus sp. EB01]|uniref:hypothetical protein n=1 Tax=Bacillus sp. EB01 TaxID=1347086 RepID=UPI0005C772AE|nr:hypothetical protein [Bacillus sp. EB01]